MQCEGRLGLLTRNTVQRFPVTAHTRVTVKHFHPALFTHNKEFSSMLGVERVIQFFFFLFYGGSCTLTV